MIFSEVPARRLCRVLRRVIKACCFAIRSVRLLMLSSWAIEFADQSMTLKL